jgi:hypothetical protein
MSEENVDLLKFPQAWAVVVDRANTAIPATINDQLPIFWYRRRAEEAARLYGGRVVKVTIERTPSLPDTSTKAE